MISRKLPAAGNKLCESITTGVPDRQSSKLSIFNPAAVDRTGYTVGRHHAFPRGTIIYPPSDEVVLLHYKHVDPAYTVKRQHLLAQGFSDGDRANNWGEQYGVPEETILRHFEWLEVHAVDIKSSTYDPDRDHRGLRTWRLSRPHECALHYWKRFRQAAPVFMNRHKSLRGLLRTVRYLRRRLDGL
jgi:hypothetical protein